MSPSDTLGHMVKLHAKQSRLPLNLKTWSPIKHLTYTLDRPTSILAA